MPGKLVRFYLSFLLAAPLSALAQSAPSGSAGSVTAAAYPPLGSGGGTIWVTFITLVLLVGAVLLVAWLLRRGVAGQLTSSSIKVIAAQSIGPRERLVVVSISGRAYLLGHTASNITMLTELEPEEVAQLSEASPARTIAGKFAQILERSK